MTTTTRLRALEAKRPRSWPQPKDVTPADWKAAAAIIRTWLSGRAKRAAATATDLRHYLENPPEKTRECPDRIVRAIHAAQRRHRARPTGKQPPPPVSAQREATLDNDNSPATPAEVDAYLSAGRTLLTAPDRILAGILATAVAPTTPNPPTAPRRKRRRPEPRQRRKSSMANENERAPSFPQPATQSRAAVETGLPAVGKSIVERTEKSSCSAEARDATPIATEPRDAQPIATEPTPLRRRKKHVRPK